MQKDTPLKGKLFIISAPSGCGKTTLAKRLLEDDLGLEHSVSVTTRPPRPGEIDGVDYSFVSHKTFDKMVSGGEFLEHEDNFGKFYGTPKNGVEKILKKGRSVLLSIDVKGAMRVKKLYPKRCVLVFILPPSIKALKKRLHGRKSDKAEDIRRRLKLARKEMSYKDRYNHRVINDRLDAAYRRLKNIIITEQDK
jgi:guanylate kinase